MSAHLIKDFQSDEKPREKALFHGVSVLTDTELLALVLRSGGKNESVVELARSVLNKFGGLPKLCTCNSQELIKFKNIGIAKATAIKAACEIALRVKSTCAKKFIVKKPEDVKRLMQKDLYGKSKEYLYVISLDARRKVLAKDLVSIGTATESLIHPREVFKKAIAQNAVYIILVHNHPSNDPTPSLEDVQVTKQLAEAGQKVGIPLLDHIIMSDSEFSSMKTLEIFTEHKIETLKGGDVNEKTKK